MSLSGRLPFGLAVRPRVAIASDRRGTAYTQVLLRIAITALVVAVHHVIVPASGLIVLLRVLVCFALLVFARSRRATPIPPLPRLSPVRVFAFLAVHASLILLAAHFSNYLAFARQDYSVLAALFAATKLAVLLPTVILFPSQARLLKLFAPELIAAAVVVFTSALIRLIYIVWPFYSQLLGAAIGYVSSLLVDGVTFHAASYGSIVLGPRLNLELGTACSGVEGLQLFQILFGLFAFLEWNRINKLRALMLYGAGILVFLAANYLRLLILFVSGNLMSSYINVNWLLFSVTFLALITLSYRWLVPPSEPALSPAHTEERDVA